jgi:uncharacterized protein (DUF2141 family)
MGRVGAWFGIGVLAPSILAAAIVAGVTQAAPTPLAATLRVTVEGVTPAGGTLRVGLYDEATFPALPELPLFKREIAKAAGNVVVTFERLPPGTYAVKVLQDLNNDGRWEMGEPFGVSNAAARDNYDAAAIVLQPGVNMTTVRLH